MVDFDQCALGLRDQIGAPLRKPTRFLTNNYEVVRRFQNHRCRCTVPHGVIRGSLNGIQTSERAQRYPRLLCDEILAAVFGAREI